MIAKSLITICIMGALCVWIAAVWDQRNSVREKWAARVVIGGSIYLSATLISLIWGV